MKVYFCLLLCFFALQTNAQVLMPVANASTVQFSISNLGFAVDGRFSGLQGTITFDEANLSAAVFRVSVAATTIDTDNETRDKHLRGEDYFHVKAFPLIQMQSVKIAKSVKAGYYVFFGKLTIKDITKEISFPFTANAETGAYRFKGQFTIKRRDFGVGGKNTISNDLTVKLDVLTKK